MAELFTKDEIYTDTASNITMMYEAAIKNATKEVLGLYGDIPLRQLEYIATSAVSFTFNMALLDKMYKKSKEQDNEQNR